MRVHRMWADLPMHVKMQTFVDDFIVFAIAILMCETFALYVVFSSVAAVFLVLLFMCFCFRCLVLVIAMCRIPRNNCDRCRVNL